MWIYCWKHFVWKLWHHLLVTTAPWQAFDGQKRQYWPLFNSKSVYAWLAIDPTRWLAHQASWPSVYTKTADTADMHWYGTHDTAARYNMWPSMTKQPYCADNQFLVKATIANYNLWTIASTNLKSLACVVMEIWANQNVPGSPVIKICSKCDETLLRTLHTEVCWPCPRSQWARWLPKRWKKSSSWHFDGKEQKTKCVYRSLVHKIEQRNDWTLFPVQLPCLPSCNYGNTSASWTVNVSYTADFWVITQ